MTEKIVEVLAKILDGLNKNISIEEVSTLLSRDKTFDKRTVSAAFSLVYDKVLSHKIKKNNTRSDNKNFRLLTEQEKEILGNDNSTYLMYLYNVGLLDTADLEMVLEQIMMFPEDSVNKNDINWLVYIALIEFSTEIMPGSRILLNSDDNIN